MAYVIRDGINLLDAQKQPLRLLGLNRWNIAQKGQDFRTVEDWFAEASQLGLNAIRFWFFQEQAELSNTNPVYYAPYFTRLRAILALCKRYGFYAIPVLGNHWGNADGESGTKSPDWYANGYRAVYGKYKLSFTEWVAAVCSEFRDDPTIAFWQMMNEAECPNVGAFQEFANRIGATARAADNNHLISLGTMGGNQAGMGAYAALHSVYDMGDYHDYNHPAEPMAANLSIRASQMYLAAKPIIVGEAGINSVDVGDAEWLAGGAPARATALGLKIDAFFGLPNAATWLLWSYRDTAGQLGGFDVAPADPMFGVLLTKATMLRLRHPS